MAIRSSLIELFDKGTTSARKLCYELAEEKVGVHGEAPCENPNIRTVLEDDVYSFIISGICNGKIEAIGEECLHILKNKLDQFIQAKETFDYQLSRVKAGRGTSETALRYCAPNEIRPLQEAFRHKSVEDDFVRAREALDDVVYSLNLRVTPLQAMHHIAQNERVRGEYLSKTLLEYLANAPEQRENTEDATMSTKNSIPARRSQKKATARTGSTKNWQTAIKIKSLAFEINGELPPLKKIKKNQFMDELRRRCEDADIQPNTTDERAAWKDFPQERKYGAGEK